MGTTAKQLDDANHLKLSAELKLTSNGEGAKTAKVQVVARSGDPIVHPYWGPVVHDFSGMSVKPRIPLDWEHGGSLGYLNKFDTSSGDLMCSGAIVLTNTPNEVEGILGCEIDAATLVELMSGGVPYEASIQFGDDATLEFVPEGMSASVNGREVSGPVVVVRQWQLKAVAICKFGADSNTSAELQFSEKKNQQSGKGFFVRLSKKQTGGQLMSENQKPVEAVEAPTATVEVVADVKAEDHQQKDHTATGEAKAVEAVETAKVEQPVEVAAGEPVLAMSKAVAVEAVDPRSEFKQFVAEFGDKAGDYFAKGLSFGDASKEHMKFLKASLDDVTKRLSAIDRGAPQPVKFSDGETPKQDKSGMAAVVRMASAKKK